MGKVNKFENHYIVKWNLLNAKNISRIIMD